MAPVKSIIAFWSGILVVAACAVISAPQHKPEPQTEKTETSNQRAPETGPVQQVAISVNAALTNAGSPNSDTNTSGDTNEKENDAVEEAMPWIYRITADGWAQWVMAALAFAGVLISAWAVVLLKKTLKANMDLIGKTDKAIGVAEQTNDITREIGEAQVRAYISVRDISCHYLPGSKTLRVYFAIANNGQSPSSFSEMGAVASVLLSKQNGIEMKSSKRTYLPLGDIPAGAVLEQQTIELGYADNLFSIQGGEILQIDDIRVTLVFMGRDVFKKDILVAKERSYKSHPGILDNTLTGPIPLWYSGMDGLAINHVADIRETRTQNINIRFSEMVEQEARQRARP